VLARTFAALIGAPVALIKTLAAFIESFVAFVGTLVVLVETHVVFIKTFVVLVATFAARAETFAAPVGTFVAYVETLAAVVEAFAALVRTFVAVVVMLAVPAGVCVAMVEMSVAGVETIVALVGASAAVAGKRVGVVVDGAFAGFFVEFAGGGRDADAECESGTPSACAEGVEDVYGSAARGFGKVGGVLARGVCLRAVLACGGVVSVGLFGGSLWLAGGVFVDAREGLARHFIEELLVAVDDVLPIVEFLDA
jgi:hypothetical protein